MDSKPDSAVSFDLPLMPTEGAPAPTAARAYSIWTSFPDGLKEKHTIDEQFSTYLRPSASITTTFPSSALGQCPWSTQLMYVTWHVWSNINKMPFNKTHSFKRMLLDTFLFAITESASLHEEFWWQHRNWNSFEMACRTSNITSIKTDADFFTTAG